MSVFVGPRRGPDCSICLHPIKGDTYVSECPGRHIFHFECASDYYRSCILQRKTCVCPDCRSGPAWPAGEFPADQDAQQLQEVEAARARARQIEEDREEALRMQAGVPWAGTDAEDVPVARPSEETIIQSAVDESRHMPPARTVTNDDLVANMEFQMAATYGDVNTVDRLIRAGVSINSHGGVALRSAAANNHLGVVERLIEAGADIHAGNDADMRVAEQRGHVGVVEILRAASQ